MLGRSGRKISERRIRQMLQAGELEGERDEAGRWRIPRRVVNRLLTERRERERLRERPQSGPEAPESVRELMESAARREGARALRGPSGAHGAGGEHDTRRTGPAPSGAGSGEGGAPAAGRTPRGRTAAGVLVPAIRGLAYSHLRIFIHHRKM